MSGWWLAAFVGLWVLCVVNVLALLIVLRHVGLIYLRTSNMGLRLEEGPAVGFPIAFDELDFDGRPMHFPSPASVFNILLFAMPRCSLCKEALRGLAAVVRSEEVSATVLSIGEDTDNLELRELVGDRATLVVSLPRQRNLGVRTIPYGIVTNERGVILAKGIVNHIDDLENLMDRAKEKVRERFEVVSA
jgi:methylamine dehydrogenase accessory protein MauD